jgi:hypothetical protein
MLSAGEYLASVRREQSVVSPTILGQRSGCEEVDTTTLRQSFAPPSRSTRSEVKVDRIQRLGSSVALLSSPLKRPDQGRLTAPFLKLKVGFRTQPTFSA